MTLRPANEDRPVDAFPLDHISASSMISFSTNPILFKIKYLNRDEIDTTTNISAVIGKAFHHAMEVYYAKDGPTDEGEAIRLALEAGMEYMAAYPEGFINYSKTVDVRQKALERVSFAVTEYVKFAKRDAETTVACEEKLVSEIDIDWRGEKVKLPVPLKGYIDRTTRDAKGRLKIRDYKTCSSFSDLDKIDGCKIIQAVEYYLLAYAAYGEAPYSLTYEEVKTTKNKDGGPQVREYEIVFGDNELYFDFYFRLFADMVRALNGEMVYVPNVRTMFDNEVSIVAYIQRLDVPEQAAKEMKKHQVSTLTDVLKSEMQSAANVRKLMSAVEGQLTEAKSMNYESMKNNDKIQTKFLEHGIVLRFDSVVEGATVDLYRFSPSIGVKMSRIKQYAEDIQQVLGATTVRVLAPIPGTTLVGFEVPRETRRFPTLPAAAGYEIAIGETINGDICRFDLRDAPHMLVAGSSGSGKSVFLHSLIRQLLETESILKLADPKQVEFAQYGAVTERDEIAAMISGLVDEMQDRYARLRELKMRDARQAGWKPIFLFVDEYADLVTGDEHRKPRAVRVTETMTKKGKVTLKETSGDEATIADNVQRIAQKGRAAGIHIILATQRASTKIVTGDVKVNFPVKAVFRMAKKVDSQVMLDEDGAEQLLGKGDMLFSTDQGIQRLQGFYL